MIRAPERDLSRAFVGMCDWAKIQTAVYLFEEADGWHVREGGDVHGPFRTKLIAARFAIDVAYTAGSKGMSAQVVAKDEREGWTPVWTYELDSYPPSNFFPGTRKSSSLDD